MRLVDPGNIVRAVDATGLVVITQIQPISVIFSVPEDNLPQVLSRLKGSTHLSVDAYDREQVKKLATGRLLTVDNQVDPTTGTVRLKTIFETKDNGLFPNQFVNARLLIDTKRDAVIVPSAAIQRGPQGAFVFVVKPDKTADICPVMIGEIQGGEVSISTGLVGGELVVVDGAEKLRKGIPVDLKGDGNQGNNGQRRGDEFFPSLHPETGSYHPVDGRHHPGRRPGLSPAPCLCPASGGLPDHPSTNRLSSYLRGINCIEWPRNRFSGRHWIIMPPQELSAPRKRF